MSTQGSIDAKVMVERGYDEAAAKYLRWTSSKPTPRLKYLPKLLDLLPNNASALEVGCGAGEPCTRLLSQRAKTVAVDISAEQIAMARTNIINVEFVHADIMTLDFERDSFDAICSFYTVFYLPREEQQLLFQRFASWIRRGGHLLINLGTSDFAESVEPDWLGVCMYWSSFGTQKYLELIRLAGFEILEWEIIEDVEEEDETVPFLWLLASKA